MAETAATADETLVDHDALHSLGNQLNLVLGMIELVLEDTPSTDPRHPDLHEARRAASEAAAILSQFRFGSDR